jgi:hypothetical protein
MLDKDEDQHDPFEFLDDKTFRFQDCCLIQ